VGRVQILLYPGRGITGWVKLVAIALPLEIVRLNLAGGESCQVMQST